jgi:L-seryl-tRNA(Ser) seleniumtransferase
VPHLVVTYDPATVGITPREVHDKLRAQDPSIELNPATGGKHSFSGDGSGENQIVVGTWMLQPGEDEIVGRELRKVLTSGKAA